MAILSTLWERVKMTKWIYKFINNTLAILIYLTAPVWILVAAIEEWVRRKND